MASKKNKLVNENEIEVGLDLTPSIEVASPVVVGKQVDLKIGYVLARRKDGKGGTVQLPFKDIGKIYKESDWEIISDKKK